MGLTVWFVLINPNFFKTQDDRINKFRPEIIFFTLRVDKVVALKMPWMNKVYNYGPN